MQELGKNPISSILGNRGIPVSVHVYETLDSTNTEAKRLAINGHTEDLLIVAAEQTAGRGRMGRSFYSPRDTGAYFSLLYTPKATPDAAVTVTCAASVAVLRAIRSLTGKRMGIKWVNDLYSEGRKVCGILCESVNVNGVTRFIIGIGINITTSFEGSELEKIAGALSDAPIASERLIAEVIAELYPLLESPEGEGWIEEYRSASVVLGRRVRFTCGAETKEGVAEEIDRDGALIVLGDDGIRHRLFSGEITLRTQ